MRVLFCISEGYGHLFPLVPLARALTEAGAQVAVAAPAHFVTPAIKLQLWTIPLTGSGVRPQDAEFATRQATRSPYERCKAAMERYLDQAVLQTQAMLAAAERWKADLIVREVTAFVGWFAGELLGLPVAVFDYAGLRPRWLSSKVGRQFTEARARVGLPADHSLASLNQWLHIVAAPPNWLSASEIGPTTCLFQPPDDSVDRRIPYACVGSSNRSRPLVYVTLGTRYNATPGIFESIFAGLAGMRVDVVATVGHDIDPAIFAGLPSNFRLERFVPQSMLLPHADVVVCHGGYGSLMGALRRGVPVVAIPLAAWDNDPNSKRLAAIGAGIRLPEDRRDPNDVRCAVGEILGDPGYQLTTRLVARSIARMPPLAAAVPLVERLANERSPVSE